MLATSEISDVDISYPGLGECQAFSDCGLFAVIFARSQARGITLTFGFAKATTISIGHKRKKDLTERVEPFRQTAQRAACP
jgi:hypothetical protein